jgi:CDP-paratose 2-epimerase
MTAPLKFRNGRKRIRRTGANGSPDLNLGRWREMTKGRSQCRPVLITGGAGFIGSNLADHLLSSGYPVLIFDNLSRCGVEKNVEWLAGKHGRLLRVEEQDVRNCGAVQLAVREATAVFHFAAQVAVTDSLVDPRRDFEINALGTLNVLEALRNLGSPVPLMFTSTNKVYGALSNLKLETNYSEYRPVASSPFRNGISESRPLDFESPYGCSKGAADQYVCDYARTFRLPAAVFRMSCIYGPHQFGTEDQGWVAHFLIRASEKMPITIYGDGKQVRDLLYVDDLLNAFLLAVDNIERISGGAFNIGGGASNALSLFEVIDLIAELHGEPVSTRLDAWRPADQHYYVSDTTKFSEATGWRPETSARDGITKLYRWLEESDIALLRTAPGHDRGRISAVRTVAVHPARTSASAIPST